MDIQNSRHDGLARSIDDPGTPGDDHVPNGAESDDPVVFDNHVALLDRDVALRRPEALPGPEALHCPDVLYCYDSGVTNRDLALWDIAWRGKRHHLDARLQLGDLAGCEGVGPPQLVEMVGERVRGPGAVGQPAEIVRTGSGNLLRRHSGSRVGITRLRLRRTLRKGGQPGVRVAAEQQSVPVGRGERGKDGGEFDMHFLVDSVGLNRNQPGGGWNVAAWRARVQLVVEQAGIVR